MHNFHWEVQFWATMLIFLAAGVAMLFFPQRFLRADKRAGDHPSRWDGFWLRLMGSSCLCIAGVLLFSREGFAPSEQRPIWFLLALLLLGWYLWDIFSKGKP